MELNDIKSLVDLLEKSSLEELKFEKDGMKIKLKKAGVQAATPQVVQTIEQSLPTQAAVAQDAASLNTKQITSPMVGTFYTSSTPGATPFVKVGDKVCASSIVCMIEAMKLFNEIEAETDGEIVEIHVTNGQLVEFGQPLFTVKI